MRRAARRGSAFLRSILAGLIKMSTRDQVAESVRSLWPDLRSGDELIVVGAAGGTAIGQFENHFSGHRYFHGVESGNHFADSVLANGLEFFYFRE